MHWKASIKLKTEKLRELGLHLTRGCTLRNWLKVLKGQHMEEVYKITKELVNTNTKTDPPVLDRNGNILSTDEERIERWKEHF